MFILIYANVFCFAQGIILFFCYTQSNVSLYMGYSSTARGALTFSTWTAAPERSEEK